MPIPKCGELEIGLQFECDDFNEHNNFSEDSYKPNEITQVIWVRSWQTHEYFNTNSFGKSIFEYYDICYGNNIGYRI